MQAQATTDTKPERALRSELHRRGIRFRLHRRDLPGRPDIVLVRARVAVFVDGCFWHGCPEHFTTPKNNRDWWVDKIETNRQRDRRVDQQFIGVGWKPVHIWEHEDPAEAADRLEWLWHESSHGLLKRHSPASGH